MAWILLTCAVLSEVGGTLALRVAALGRPSWFLPVALAYGGSFAFLSLTLRRGIGVGVAYGVWTACGVALIAVLGRLLFHERLGRIRLLGITLIASGVAIVEVGATR